MTGTKGISHTADRRRCVPSRAGVACQPSAAPNDPWITRPIKSLGYPARNDRKQFTVGQHFHRDVGALDWLRGPPVQPARHQLDGL